MLTFTSVSSPGRSSAILSSTGETAWHGPHHSAQKSTRTGVSFDPSITSCWKLASLTSVDIGFLSFGCSRVITRREGGFFPLSRIESMPDAFQPLPSVPDHPALEHEVLERWEREGTFAKLRESLAGGPKWSFIDGPKTANTTDGLGVHHLWGRTYKDVFQRYKALRGFDQRFQNGFDCQGLWVEVKVERDLGLNSKREIEEFGIAGFARRCRELVAESARVIISQDIRLGRWMDWGNDYYTFSDTNIEYIWRFLKTLHEAGRFLPEYGWLHGLSTVEAADQIVGDLRERGLLENAGVYVHRYAHCWRCSTPVIFRVVDDWFIAVDEIRPKLLEANATVEWTPDFYGKRMDDWLRNMGDWNISRKRYFGLPLPFYPCACGHLNVIGSKRELEERALSGLDQLEELHRPWVDEVVIACEQCGEELRRVPEVGDVWLDAGIVPFATLGWQNPEPVPGGYATGASAGLSRADLPDHAYWEKWFPADWVTEMREQIRLWFYSLLFMSVVLEGRAPFEKVLGHEDVRDEHGHEMHGSKGNTIEAHEALERMGADVMRWMYCEQAPTQGVKFGYTPAGEIKRRLLTLWNSVSFLVTYANIEGFRPSYGDLAQTPAAQQALDRWLLARTGQLVAETTDAYERYWTRYVIRAWEAFVDDLSNWYIRRSR